MAQTLRVHLVPSLTTPEELKGRTVVVIDVLRATTTIVHAIHSGARRIWPCLEVEEARRKALQASEPAVLGGEREGLPIDGFDLGNSPLEYTEEAVRGKVVVFTTTNGTRAMRRCEKARRVLIGAFANLSAVSRALADESAVDLLCAGRSGTIAREDTLLAGALVGTLRQQNPAAWELNDAADVAADAWGTAATQPLVRVLAASQSGLRMVEIGRREDIAVAAQIDTINVVPQADPADWQIVAG